MKTAFLRVFFLPFVLCSQSFNVLETSIEKIHNAIKKGETSFEEITKIYIDRIRLYDQSTRLNSIVILNPNAIADAKALDKEYQQTKKLRPLHGIPLIVKDNFNTKNLQTTGGSLALKGSLPQDDAFQIKQLKKAGAIVLAKSNMAEWAFSAYKTESSIAGITRNPYDLTRVPAGSSGGTAAAVSANFGALGVGTDTGNSIRGPASHNGLVGIRSTMGLTSRDGIIPLLLRNDIAGPICRTVEDAVRILNVIAGYDPNDKITSLAKGKVKDYLSFLKKDGLRNKRIGVFRHYIDTKTIDPEVKAITEKAILDLKSQGATIVDPFVIADFDTLTKKLWAFSFQYEVNNYLKTLGEKAPYKNLNDIVASGLYLPSSEANLKAALKIKTAANKMDPPRLDVYHDKRNSKFRQAVLNAMKKFNVDIIIYPTWANPARKVGDMESPAGDNSQYLSPHTGMPSMTVPSGYTASNLPIGLSFVAKHFDEATLIEAAYAYEQATKHRKAPKKFKRIKN